ncbi:hypothetical protein K0M31_014966 [Melipona bicolor]|uniref:Uncharacterized protein n=1 Tax=Melipona bicolor TaxID=60889 RepID=A0AA40FGL3_9HYME|nr:hypothetical protein K0M31_014966 [Melipona bicolor]
MVSIGGGYDDDDGEDDDDDDGDGDDERRYESGEAGRAQWQPRRTSHRDFRFRRVTTARRTERDRESRQGRQRLRSRGRAPREDGRKVDRDGQR